MIKKTDKSYTNAFSLVELSMVILVIGILIVAISKGTKIYKEAKLVAAQNVTKSSTITTVKNLSAWWDATSSESFLKNDLESDDKKISIWFDSNLKTSSENHISQKNVDYKPKYEKYGINNLPAIKFEGSHYLEIPYRSELSSKEYSLFVVVRPTSEIGWGSIICSRNEPKLGMTLYINPSAQYFMQQGNGSNSWGNVSASDIKVTKNKMEILSYVRTASKLTSYSKGNLVGSNSFSYANNNNRPIRVGAGATDSDTVRYFYKGYIGEILFFNRALSNKERAKIESYLLKKWL